MELQLKDWLTIGVSVFALLVAATNFYFANVHKPADATLTLLSRSHDDDVVAIEIDRRNFYQQHKKLIAKSKTNLSYSLSNTGKQALCVKSVKILRGPGVGGDLRDLRPYSAVKSTTISSFVIEPGDIKILEISYNQEDDVPKRSSDKFRLISLELVAADGSRYQLCHNISSVKSIVSLDDPLWDGVSLGGPVRGDGYTYT